MMSLRRRVYGSGIALISTIFLVLFLLVLTGALVTTQSGMFAVSKTSDANLRGEQAILTVYSYCLYQLEHFRNWGRDGFSGVGDIDPPRANNTAASALSDRLTVTEVNGRSFSGFLPEHQCHFRVEVRNALTLSGGLALGTHAETPHEHVRLQIETWSGGRDGTSKVGANSVNVLLRLAPLFDASVLTRGDVKIHADHLYLSSMDPFRNEFRVEGTAELPGLLTGQTRFLKYHPELLQDTPDPNAVIADHNGLLWSSGDLVSNNGVLGPNDLRQAAEATGGRVIPRASNRLDIYDLEPENLPEPNAAGFDHTVELDSREYRFTKILARVDYEEYEVTNAGDPSTTDDDTWEWVPKQSNRIVDTVAVYGDNSAEPQSLHTPSFFDNRDRIRVLDVDLIGDFGELDDTTPVQVGDRVIPRGAPTGIDPPVYFDLNNNSFVVKPNTLVRINDNGANSKLEITVSEGSAPTVGPQFELGGLGNDVVIDCQGDLTLEGGEMEGIGTLISREGDVTLKPIFPDVVWVQDGVDAEGNPIMVPVDYEVDLTANENYDGLVVYAGEDVTIENSRSTDWTFRGFVYAQGRFDFDADNSNAVFFGTVVAGQSGAFSNSNALTIDNTKTLNFIYDPSYLKLLTRSLPNNWTRVEQVLWSEGS